MGLWAGIKHALNSTLGTKDFISLDKMIFSQHTYIATTEDVIENLPDFSSTVISGTNLKRYPVKFKMMSTGELYLKYTSDFDVSGKATSVEFICYKNGVPTMISKKGFETAFFKFSFKPYDEIFFEIKVIASNVSHVNNDIRLSDVSICGKAVPSVYSKESV